MLGLVLPDDCFVCDRTAAWLHAGDRALAPGEHLDVPADLVLPAQRLPAACATSSSTVASVRSGHATS